MHMHSMKVCLSRTSISTQRRYSKFHSVKCLQNCQELKQEMSLAGGLCHSSMRMRGMLWECGGDGGVKMAVVVTGDPLRCRMCCWYISILSVRPTNRALYLCALLRAVCSSCHDTNEQIFSLPGPVLEP